MLRIRNKGTKRIFFYYVIAIVLPSLLLGILAFRGVLNDQALHEKEIRQELVSSGKNIIEHSENYLHELENQFSERINSLEWEQNVKDIYNDESLISVLTLHPIIQNAVLIDNHQNRYLLNTKLLFVNDGIKSASPSISKSKFINRVNKGWELEYQNHDYQAALDYYHNLLKQNCNKVDSVYLYIQIARIGKKLKNNSLALKSFKTLETIANDIVLDAGIPVTAMASFEMTNLNLAIGDTLNCLKQVDTFLLNLLGMKWNFSESHFNQLYTMANNVINGIKEGNSKSYPELVEAIDLKISKLKTQSEITKIQLSFLENGSAFSNQILQHSDQSSVYRIYDNKDTSPLFFTILPTINSGSCILIYDLSELLNLIKNELIPDLMKDTEIEWQILSDRRELLASSDSIFHEAQEFSTSFQKNMPMWTLTLYQQNTGFVKYFLGASKGSYLYIFLLIILALPFGLFFTLQIINKELEVSKLKSDFISTVSHEFKTPLTAIRQMTEMLYSDRIKNEARKKEYYQVMLEQSERLSHLIENILDFSKIEEGNKLFQFRKTKIPDLLENVVSIFKESFCDASFEIHYQIENDLPEIMADSEAIQQVFFNILENAWKYSGEAKKVEIEVSRNSENIKISFRDYGIGISKKDQTKIFYKFYRAGNELTRSNKGSGIGLTIVKGIIEAHFGKILLESEPDKGSTFIIELPINLNHD